MTMLSNRLAFAALGTACIVAAAGGGYLATRQNATQAPAVVATAAPAQVTAAAPTPEARAPARSPEALVREAPKPVESAPVAPAQEMHAARPAARRDLRSAATPVAPKTPQRPPSSARRDYVPE